jgi:hypothetical protein
MTERMSGLSEDEVDELALKIIDVVCEVGNSTTRSYPPLSATTITSVSTKTKCVCSATSFLPYSLMVTEHAA